MKKNKTIIFLSPTPPPYMGPSIATQIILDSRFCDEFKVIHIDTADRRPLDKLAKIDITNIYLAFKHYSILLHKLIWSRAELVYIPISQTTIGFLRDVPFITLAKLFGKKVVLHLRGGYFREFYQSSNRTMKYIILKTLAKTDRMIVLGESLKALFEGLIPEEKLSVVPNGIDLSFNDEKSQTHQNSNITILFLSNLIETKGFKDVLFSAKKVINSYPDTRYIFAGDWRKSQDKIECEKYIEKEKIQENVEFKGIVTGQEKIKLLQEADIFVFPTYYPMEGHPWAIVEAMAAGLPIITTDQGCIKESVIHDENGYIVPHKSSKEIAGRTIELLNDPLLKKKMGLRSRELYQAKFTKEHFVQNMIDAINLALKDNI